MKNTINLYEIYNILKKLSQKKSNIYRDYSRYLSNDFNALIVMFKKVNISKKEIILYVKKKDDLTPYAPWHELTITRKNNGYTWKSNDNGLNVNIFNATNHLNSLLTKLEKIQEFLNMQPIKLKDTTNTCNIIISADNIKIRQNNSSLLVIPLDFQKNSNESQNNMEELLKSIYIYQDNLPAWFLKHNESTLNIDNILRKFKRSLDKFWN